MKWLLVFLLIIVGTLHWIPWWLTLFICLNVLLVSVHWAMKQPLPPGHVRRNEPRRREI